jgi:hypothetical protein
MLEFVLIVIDLSMNKLFFAFFIHMIFFLIYSFDILAIFIINISYYILLLQHLIFKMQFF